GKEIIVIPTGVKAHTSDDLFVYLPNDKVLFSGDIVMNGRVTSNRDGSVIGSLKALEMINSKKWDVLVPGHGIDTSKTAADETIKYFTLLKQRVLEAIENEVTGNDITKIVTMEEFKNKALYDELNSKNVFDAFRELEFYEEN
ncbi:MAG: MBL fold metallo-hydrolase, partial [Arcobacter sp.]